MGKAEQGMNNPYAVITGASQGLGRAFAFECAGRNINLILTSLPNENLPQTAAEIKRQFGVDVILFEADISSEEACYAFFDFVEQRAPGIQILINNAGIGSVGNFEKFPASFYQKQVKVNVLSPVLLTRLFLPLLKLQPAAYILNVSSLASFFNIPGKEVYGASKSFLYSFSRSLRLALRDTPVSVSVVCPGGINTNERIRKANASLKGIAKKTIYSPEEVAAVTIKLMLKRKAIIIPGKLNRLTLWINKFMPAYFKNKLIAKESGRQELLA